MHTHLGNSPEELACLPQETPSRFGGFGKKMAQKTSDLFSRSSLQQTLEDLEHMARSVCSGLRMKYMPLVVGAGMAVSDLNAQLSVDHFMVGADVGIESTSDNYFANRDNGHTRDGKSLHLVLAYNQGNYRGELQGGVASHTKNQDIDNLYAANFRRALLSQGISLVNANNRVVPYIMATAGRQETRMSGLRDGKEFIYQQDNFCFGGKAGIEINIAEQIKIGISGFVLVFPNDKLDNVTSAHKPLVVTQPPSTTITLHKQAQYDALYNFSAHVYYLLYTR